ncbi:MAG: hypothetical protein QXV69_09800 [Sulfolobaceae archaeon]
MDSSIISFSAKSKENLKLLAVIYFNLDENIIYMSTVYSIRIPKKLRELMNLVNVDWQKEISKYIEDRVREELIRKYIEEGRKNLAKMKNISNADLIREDREA